MNVLETRQGGRHVELDIDQHVFAVYPRQAVLVTAALDGASNITTVAWSSVLSQKPPLQGIAISPKRHTHDLIKESKKFIINVPTREIISHVVECGRATGRFKDKFTHAGLTPLPSLALGDNGPKRIEECPVNIECIVKSMVVTGDHTLFVGEVVSVSVREDLLQNGLYQPNQFQIPYHLGGHEFTFNEKRVFSF